ncbi:MAG: hypothetical protein V1692_01330, partial [bacterium]
AFYSSVYSDNYREEFLKKNNIDYVIFTSREKGDDYFNPENKDYLKKVFGNPGMVIYQPVY